MSEVNRGSVSVSDGSESKAKREKARMSIIIGVIIGLISISTFVLTAVSDGKLICCGIFGVFGLLYSIYKGVFKGVMSLWI